MVLGGGVDCGSMRDDAPSTFDVRMFYATSLYSGSMYAEGDEGACIEYRIVQTIMMLETRKSRCRPGTSDALSANASMTGV